MLGARIIYVCTVKPPVLTIFGTSIGVVEMRCHFGDVT